MQHLTHNIAPAGRAAVNTAAGQRPAPIDRRTGSGGGELSQLAQAFKIAVNSSISIEHLEMLGEERLRQLLGKVAAPPTLAATNVMTTNAAQSAADEFAGYDINAAVGGVDQGALLRLASDVKSAIWGASMDTLASLGAKRLQALLDHCTESA